MVCRSGSQFYFIYLREPKILVGEMSGSGSGRGQRRRYLRMRQEDEVMSGCMGKA